MLKTSTLGLMAIFLPCAAATAQPTFAAQPAVTFANVTANLVAVATGSTQRVATAVPGDGSVAFTSYGTTGAAGTQTSRALGGTPNNVATADCDADGRADVVVANTQARTVQVLYQDAGGSWTAGTPVALPQAPLRVAAADVNGDGLLDLVTAAVDGTGTPPYPNQLLVCLASGPRTYAAPVSYRRPASYGAVAGVLVADFTGDGRADVLLVSNSGLSLTPGLAGSALGGEQFTATASGYTDVATADLNGDSHPDVVAGQLGVAGLVVLLNTGTGVGAPVTLPLSDEVNGVAVADFDNDARLDVVATLNGNSSVALVRGAPTAGQFLAATYAAVATGSGYWGAVLAGDVTGDGKPDVVLQDVGTSSGGATVLLRNSTSPLPVELTAFTAKLAGAAVRLAWTTASEKNSTRFEIERSTDGVAFQRIGTVAAAGTSSSVRTYGQTDAQLPVASALYYRLRQVDADSSFAYSPVRAVRPVPAQGVAAYPNPTTGTFRITGIAADERVSLHDAAGRPVLFTQIGDVLTLPVTAPAGLYFVAVHGAGPTRWARVARQ